MRLQIGATICPKGGPQSGPVALDEDRAATCMKSPATSGRPQSASEASTLY